MLEVRARPARSPGASPAPRLLRLHAPLPGVEDPWDLLDAPALRGRRLLAWSDPVDGRCFLAIGVTLELHPTGPERFAEAERGWRELLRGVIDRPSRPGEPVDPGLPLLVGGFAFAEDGGQSPEWAGFGAGRLWVPELLVHGGPRGLVATISAWTDGVDAEAACAKGLGLLESLAEVRPRGSGRALAAPLPEAHPGKPAWLERVEAARREAARGALHKVVLARAEALATAEPVGAVETARALREQQPACACWLLRLEDGAAFLGASPEELLRLQGRHLRTVALAGTRRRASGAEDEALGEAMLRNPKDREEQALVVQAIREALTPLAERLDVPEAPALARFATVQHLQSRVEAQLRPGVGLFALLGRLHPTPAVGGLPRREALAWLARHEGLDRGWYAGPIGWAAPGERGVFVVALRSALLRGGQARAYAGCGLVAASEPETEWEETLHKLSAVRAGLRGGHVP